MAMISHESFETLEINRLGPARPSKVLVTHARALRSVSNQKNMLHKENAGYMSAWLEDQKFRLIRLLYLVAPKEQQHVTIAEHENARVWKKLGI